MKGIRIDYEAELLKISEVFPNIEKVNINDAREVVKKFDEQIEAASKAYPNIITEDMQIHFKEYAFKSLLGGILRECVKAAKNV